MTETIDADETVANDEAEQIAAEDCLVVALGELRRHLAELSELSAAGLAAIDMSSDDFRSSVNVAFRSIPDLDDEAGDDIRRYAGMISNMDSLAQRRGSVGLGNDAEATALRRLLANHVDLTPLRKGSPTDILRSASNALDAGHIDRGALIDLAVSLVRNDPSIARRYAALRRGLEAPRAATAPADYMPPGVLLPRFLISEIMASVGDATADDESKKLRNRLMAIGLHSLAGRRREDRELDALGLERNTDKVVPDFMGRVASTAQGLLASLYQHVGNLGIEKVRTVLQKTASYPV